MLRNCPRRKELKRRPGGGKLGYDTISSFLNLNKYCSFRLLYSWKVLASLKAWFKLWLSRFRWNVTNSRKVRGRGEALCYFASKKSNFFKLFFLGNIGQENVFYNNLERKNALLSYRTKKFKKSKNWHFSKGVSPLFLYKNGHFSTFSFKAI